MPRQNKDWFFTINNPKKGCLEKFWAYPVGYAFVCYERGKKRHTPHLHLYVEFLEDVTKQEIYKIFGFKMYVAERRGSQDQVDTYLKKDGKYMEKGERHVATPGHRTDIEKVYLCQSMEEVWKLQPAYQAVKLGQMWTARTKRPMGPIRVEWCSGDSGTGKTYYATRKFPNAYITTPPTSTGCRAWFDAYEGQTEIIVDDVRSTVYTAEFLIALLDQEKQCRLETKHGSMYSNAKNIIVTSLHSPECFWTADQQYQLLRRINVLSVHTINAANQHEQVSTDTQKEIQEKVRAQAQVPSCTASDHQT